MRITVPDERVEETLSLLEIHYRAFRDIVDVSLETAHPVPVDTRGWSQIIVSVLTGVKGLKRKKGQDLVDGSDVKGANTWEAIDTPRFNNVVKAGTGAAVSDRVEYLDGVPYLFFVLWDNKSDGTPRCRIWCARSQHDPLFREMCRRWYEAHASGEIISTNFQLHPPRGLDTDEIRNTCGNLLYPLLFCAERRNDRWEAVVYNESVLVDGLCQQAD